jgi:hypothetical protein
LDEGDPWRRLRRCSAGLQARHRQPCTHERGDEGSSK